MAQTLGKLANVSAEIGELDKTAEGTLKAFVSGDRMTFEFKGKDPFTALPTAKLLLSTNNLPRFSDKTDGVWRRVNLLLFSRRVPEGERVLGMDKPKWWLDSGELPGLFNWALAGRDRLRMRQKFTVPDSSRQALDQHRRDSNPARDFLLEYYEVVRVQDGDYDPDSFTSSTAMFETYACWCGDQRLKYPLSKSTFGKEVVRTFPHLKEVQKGDKEGRATRKVTVNGASKKVYPGVRFKGDPDDFPVCRSLGDHGGLNFMRPGGSQ
jgi:phage/plasmid-associated DNA primase